MKTSQGYIVDESILKTLGARAVKTIRLKSVQMEAEIASKMEELEFLVVEGCSANNLATAKVDGNHEVLELNFSSSYADWNDKRKTCALLAEAINDAHYKIDLAIETEISSIKHKYIRAVINETEKQE